MITKNNSKYQNKSTKETSTEIKQEERVKELETMATVQQIQTIVDNAVKDLKKEIKSQGDGLGKRTDELTTEVQINSNRLLVLETKIDERIPKKPLIQA
ncbi:hypothetical protein HC864_02585 [Candidatus Gracilibacteria bacterium]|nr:hypothetical protein [Candidatus Gracilibacteria bacterium]